MEKPQLQRGLLITTNEAHWGHCLFSKTCLPLLLPSKWPQSHLCFLKWIIAEHWGHFLVGGPGLISISPPNSNNLQIEVNNTNKIIKFTLPLHTRIMFLRCDKTCSCDLQSDAWKLTKQPMAARYCCIATKDRIGTNDTRGCFDICACVTVTLLHNGG